MPRPTVHDIAREAGVSLATVDRVLNARPGVRENTIERVELAIRKLGYVRDTHAANLARRREYRFCYVLPESSDQFVGTIRLALRQAGRSQLVDRVDLTILNVPGQDPHVIARALDELGHDSVDGVALMVRESPQVRDAAARIRRAGVAVVTLVSDLPEAARDHFIGVNGVAAGRTAGLLMGRFVGAREGDVMVVANSLQSHASIDRRLGFDTIIKQEFNHLRPLPTLETHGEQDRALRTLSRAIEAYPDVVGIYSMVGDSETILEALKPIDRSRDRVVIMHELAPATRAGLISREVDAVINQNVGHLVRSSLRVLRAICDDAPLYEEQEMPRIEIVTRENLPAEI